MDTDEDWRPLARGLARALKKEGALVDPRWERAFLDTPRHVFVPAYFVNRWAAERKPGWGAVGAGDPGWLDAVYSTAGLFTQFDGDPHEWQRRRDNPEPDHAPGEDGFIRGRVTSSSSEPPLMARMLQALDVHDGCRVLEIGTGTGYNAGLLCHRLGASNVTSVDIDANLVASARDRLASLGYAPRLAVADATRELPPGPYDRIIATVGVGSVPPHWIAQVQPGGVVLVHFESMLAANGLYALTVDDRGGAAGRAVLNAVFMPTRDRLRAYPAELQMRAVRGDGARSVTTLPASVVDDYGDFHTFLSLHLRDAGMLTWEGATWLVSPDGSWAVQELDEPHAVTQHGPRRLWTQAEEVWRSWKDLGEPGRDRLGITIAPDGTHTLWIDSPNKAATRLHT